MAVVIVVPSSVAYAEVIDEPTGGGSGGTAGFGDPDVPTGIARQSLPQGGVERGVVVGSSRVAGDGVDLSNPRTWRLQTWVTLMRSYFFRF